MAYNDIISLFNKLELNYHAYTTYEVDTNKPHNAISLFTDNSDRKKTLFFDDDNNLSKVIDY